MNKKAISLQHLQPHFRRVMFAAFFFSASVISTVGAETVWEGDKLTKEQVLQDNKQISVQGTVKDVNGEPLIGVSVKVQGSSVGTVTDLDGQFTLSVPSSSSALVFSYVGYIQQNIVVASRKIFDIVLKDDAQQLEQVVVTAPIGVQRPPKQIGYSVSSVSSKQLTESGSTNFASALYGKAAGVKISTPPGGATGAVNVQIRGINSLNFNQQPLYVVDGVMIRNDSQNGAKGANNGDYWSDQKIRGNGAADINPADIESLTILKGASASALYGSDAGSGVVVITTKKGSRREGLGVEFSYNGAFESVTNLPTYQEIYGPGYSPNVNLSNGADVNGWFYDGNKAVNGGKRPYFRAYGQFGPKLDGSQVTWWDGQARTYGLNKNNYADLFQVGYSSNINVALSKQTDVVNYRLSYSRLDYEGIQIGGNQKKNTFSLNSTVNLNKDITLDLVATYLNTNILNRPQSTSRLLSSYDGFFSRAEDVSLFLDKYKTSTGYKWVPSANSERNREEALKYPIRSANTFDYLWDRLKNRYEEEENRLMSSATLNWKISPKFKFRGRLGNDYTAANVEDRKYAQYPAAYAPNNGSDDLGSFEITKNQYSILYGDALVTYNQDVTSDLNFTLAGGWQGREEKYLGQKAGTRDGLITENWFSLTNSYSVLSNARSTIEVLKYAYLGIFNMSYKDMLFFEATARQEYSSTLPPKNNSFFYPSGNASFIFSEAMTLPTWWTYGKARASYGIVGNPPPVYVANVLYDQNVLQYDEGSYPALTMDPTYGNPDLVAEKKHELEFGLETRFWDDRASLDVSFYTNKVKNQILELAVPMSSGSQAKMVNAGEIGSKGLEIAASVTPIIGDVRWTTRFNIGFNTSKVNALNDGIKELRFWDQDQSSVKLSATVGETLGNIYSYDRKRNDKGELLISDKGYYVIDQSKYVKYGNIMPKAVGGWSNTIDYKGFSVDFTIDYRLGGQLISPSTKYAMGAGMYESTLWGRDAEHGGLAWDWDYKDTKGNIVSSHKLNDGILLEGVNEKTGLPNTTIVSAADYYNTTYAWGANGWNDGMVYDNSYIKFREITLGYRIPANIARSLKMGAIKVSVYARNLFYIWKSLDNIDPEAAIGSKWFTQGIDASASPASKTLGFSVSANF
ncbi:MAG: hypothetical protein RL662_632 [Bacteroidota bacterium]|jgi:iron complex outermembrane receptor protein